MENLLKALFLGDIIGKPGCRAVFIELKKIIKENKIDFTAANGENASDGLGITPEILKQLFESGINVITSGNHIWQKKEILKYLDDEPNLLRPANYPKSVHGKGFCIYELKDCKVGVINLQGRERLISIDCPFITGEKIANSLKKQTNIILVDFHAESTEEKEALGFYLDGKVSCVLGTHTHIQTADEKILKNGTGFITDIGMVGPEDSVIGSTKEIAIKKAVTQMPLKTEVAETSPTINGVILIINKETGKTEKIETIKIKTSF